MPLEDAIRWDQRYQDRSAKFESPRSFLIQNISLLPDRGLALDVAMGLGQNASALLARGLQVIGVDISITALRQAKQAYPNLMAFQADLARFHFPPQKFDVILNFYYLQRDLLSRYTKLLKPGGILVLETLTRHMLTHRPDTPTQYLLEEGELRRTFQDWDILVYNEGWSKSDHGNHKAVASIVARLPE